MASGNNQEPQLLDEETYNKIKGFLLEIGGMVNGCPLRHFIATVEHIKSISGEVDDVKKRENALLNLNRFEKIAKSLLPFQKMVEEVAEEASKEKKESGIILVDTKITH